MTYIKPPETITVETEKFSCDGNARNESGHPRVYLTMTSAGSVDCPYCGRHFVLIKGVKTVNAH